MRNILLVTGPFPVSCLNCSGSALSVVIRSAGLSGDVPFFCHFHFLSFVQGMEIIETMDAKEFRTYLQQYGNTICGRNPISILLSAIRALEIHPKDRKLSLKFLNYAQSNACKNTKDSSVSYASASLVFE